MTQPQGKTHRTVERVRWADVDLVKIMRFSAFTRLVEFAEQELMRDAGIPYAELFDSPAVWLPRKQLTIEYLAPARIDELLEVETYVSRIGETAMTYQFDVRNEPGTLVAAATMVVVCVDADSFRKTAIPRELAQRMAPYHLSVSDARAAYTRPSAG